MQKFTLEVLGVSECRGTVSGHKAIKEGSTSLFSGKDEAHFGSVALFASKVTPKFVIEWKSINDLLLNARFDFRY